MYFAHSPKLDLGIAAQTYKDHINAVIRYASTFAVACGETKFSELFRDAVRLAAEYHDLGKLDPLNQAILAKESLAGLSINHVDAGVAEMLRHNELQATKVAALLIFAHHQGLPDLQSELKRSRLRDIDIDDQHGSVKSRTDQFLDNYIERHQSEVTCPTMPSKSSYVGASDMRVFYRMALSCLVDADHLDTSINYAQAERPTAIPLRAAERLKQLDTYVASLAVEKQDQRTELRANVYQSCRESRLPRGMVACDSPVGSGKTTAVMAHLLRTADDHGMRRIFVVLPYTNIIAQSVEVYRKCLVLPDENPEAIVAAHHHRAEFSDVASRHLTYRWDAPIVVTTAVQFFETLAAARTGALRKFHQLANSAIFIDESHAALPAHLWPVAWKWLQRLQAEWNCHFVLGSGSLSRFWTIPEFSDPPVQLPNLVDSILSEASDKYETTRVRFVAYPQPLSLEDLVNWVLAFRGPRLLIANTVQSAAYIAQSLQCKTGKSVEHLSTALCPADREKTLGRVKQRLKNKLDNDWTLVATSCVEAGVDISFRTGFRERSSLNSLLQTSGRINRGGEFDTADVWDYQVIYDHRLRKHPAFEDSAAVLETLFIENKVSPQHCTEAMRREIRRAGMKLDAKRLDEAEQKQEFKEVESRFKVIDSHTEIAVVDTKLKRRLMHRELVTFQELQNGSVQIYSSRRIDFALAPIVERPGIYEWTLKYDNFLGYMAGVIDNVAFLDSGAAFA